MSLDHTQQQTLGDLRRSEQLSLQTDAPPVISGFHIHRPLGQGAFGQVWLAVDLNTRRPVAIKCYLNRGSLNMELLSREVSLLANMAAGRSIVQVLKVGWDHEPPYFVMEYLENGSLEELIRSGEELSVAQCVQYTREIAEGLSFAHGKGILHCDLKPANVLLDHSFQPRLADFGQGRMAGDQTSSLGTLFYMSPEQADMKAAPDVTWDVYSLGAIAYTLLVGTPPYRSPQIIEMLDTTNTLSDRLERYRQTILQSPRPRLHHRRRGVDKQLALIIDRCLHVDPSKRYQNAQQLIGALENRRRARSRRPLYVLGLVGPILLMGLMLLFSARSRQVALGQSEQSVVGRALESNRFAARYAARTLESELQSLFRIAEAEAQRHELRELLSACSQTAADPLHRLAQGSADTEATRHIQNLPAARELEQYLYHRLEWMTDNHNDSDALLNSVFINELGGTNLAIAFTDDFERQTANSPVGQNFAFRSYFTGARVDGPRDRPPGHYQPTRQTRLSASFRSTSTGAWKIGISTPIWDAADLSEDGAVSDSAEPLGVFVLTINLGDFELLSERDEPNGLPVRFAALFDGRSGNQRGTLLQHPFIRDMDRQRMRTLMIPQIPAPVLDALTAGGLDHFKDPVSDFEGGEPFAGEWIASIAQVELPRTSLDRSDEREKSDLWILVQERKSSVSAPIRSLATSLQRESMIEIVSLLCVILALWYFVFRLGQVAISGGGRSKVSSDKGSVATETRRL